MYQSLYYRYVDGNSLLVRQPIYSLARYTLLPDHDSAAGYDSSIYSDLSFGLHSIYPVSRYLYRFSGRKKFAEAAVLLEEGALKLLKCGQVHVLTTGGTTDFDHVPAGDSLDVLRSHRKPQMFST